MGCVSIEKITLMLEVYRERLERASAPPINYIEGARLEAQIGILEHLFILAHQNAAQQSVHPTVLNAREIEVICPNCSLVFDVPLPESHSG